jgi:hypothetical protein
MPVNSALNVNVSGKRTESPLRKTMYSLSPIGVMDISWLM